MKNLGAGLRRGGAISFRDHSHMVISTTVCTCSLYIWPVLEHPHPTNKYLHCCSFLLLCWKSITPGSLLCGTTAGTTSHSTGGVPEGGEGRGGEGRGGEGKGGHPVSLLTALLGGTLIGPRLPVLHCTHTLGCGGGLLSVPVAQELPSPTPSPERTGSLARGAGGKPAGEK